MAPGSQGPHRAEGGREGGREGELGVEVAGTGQGQGVMQSAWGEAWRVDWGLVEASTGGCTLRNQRRKTAFLVQFGVRMRLLVLDFGGREECFGSPHRMSGGKGKGVFVVCTLVCRVQGAGRRAPERA